MMVGDLRNFDQDKWRSIRMDIDQDNPVFTESSFWPPLNLATTAVPIDFLVSSSYSQDLLDDAEMRSMAQQCKEESKFVHEPLFH